MDHANDAALQPADDCCRFPYIHPRTHHEGRFPDGTRLAAQALAFRDAHQGSARWAAGYGPIRHSDLTQTRAHAMAETLVQRGRAREIGDVFRILEAADRLTCAGMWLTVHMTYARNVYLDGRELATEDFKPDPEGHTGGALNMVPAYVGYLTANALTSTTRSWLMGQGHCVAAIDAVNVLVGNTTAAHATRYGLSNEGLTRLVRDFYSYAVQSDGQPTSPLGSHVSVNTAGGILEGGYLGFAELQYMHMPLPGERLVAFLSDGAFEEQRGSDWAPRWWRAEDCGLVTPIMILNGRRIEQRTSVAQEGGVDWFREHLRLNGFEPIDIDGRDPAAFAWAILEMEEWLESCCASVRAGRSGYPVPLRYAIAETVKGFGFPGAGTNLAHNLPLGANPQHDAAARQNFNTGARDLWVPPDVIQAAVSVLNTHETQQRVRERDHALARRHLALPLLPELDWHSGDMLAASSPMEAIDTAFCALVRANPNLRVRVGNPDELRSNRMGGTLDLLKHRVLRPEAGVAEAVDGAVITALNEEAVVSAALANKGGLNLVVSYEAFAVKMLGALRQEILFARHQREAGATPGWLSVPVIATSHTWENGKNEQSHQDPTFCEAQLGEMSDVSRVLFPADWNSAMAAFTGAYQTRGEIWTLVVPKRAVAERFSPAQAQALVAQGVTRVCGTGEEGVVLCAIGAYQLTEALRAHQRLRDHGIGSSVVYLIEPARLRAPRDALEAAYVLPEHALERWFPGTARVRVMLSHTRPEPIAGLLRRIDSGTATTHVLGYISRGGTLDVAGMLFANRCTWAHAIQAVAESLNRSLESLLSEEEFAAVRGHGNPAVLTAK